MLKTKSMLDLQLFAEGGAEGGTGAVAQSQEGSNTQSTVYGSQPDDGNGSIAENQNSEDSTIDLDAEFAELIKKDGKYAQQYQKKLKENSQERSKGLQQKLKTAEDIHLKFSNEVNPVLDKLFDKYGIQDRNIDALNSAIDSDENFYDEAALKAGMSPSEYKKQLEINRLESEAQKRHDAEIAQQKVQSWINEAEQLKQIYPDFDLNAEADNAIFASLLNNGFPMKNAYEAAHHDELMATAMQHVAQTTEKKVTNSLMANKSRPVENGVSSHSASRVKQDLSSASDEELDAIDKRVQRGERITFA